MSNLKQRLLCGFTILLAACVSPATGNDVPARIVAPDASSRSELQSVVSEALDRAEILLADDALVHASQLIITRKQHKTIEGGLLQGRSYELPVHFDLVINNSRCYLVQRSTGERWHLRQTKCVASP